MQANKLVQELFNLNSSEMEFLIKSPSMNKTLVPAMFIGEFHKTSKEEVPIIYTLFIKLKGKTPISFYEASIFLISKTSKEITRKKNTPSEHKDKNFKQNFSKENVIHRKIRHNDQVGIILGLQGWLNNGKSINIIHHVNPLKKKTHVIISIEPEKAFDKI